ncbi:MAG: DUF58 domain-containing protein [Puniceicoccales bacterium]|nr:DUF58 domain-containing protein [Puniceicoccales bacterium]
MNSIRQQSQAASAAFRLPLRDAVWRGMHGQFAGQGSGSSLDFQDHRPYFPGDDPRHINWQAYARTGNYTMKLYRQEVSPRVDLLIDTSASMFIEEVKAVRVFELAAFCAESALRLGAALRIHALDTTGIRLIPTEALLADAAAALTPRQAPAAPKPAVTKTASPAALSAARPELTRAPFRHGSLRVFISDLLFPSDLDGLRPLATGQGRGIVFAPWSEAEASPAWDGNYHFEDIENGALERRRVTPALLRRYKDAYARHFDTWRDAARRHGIRLARTGTGTALTRTLRSEALPVGAVEPCA